MALKIISTLTNGEMVAYERLDPFEGHRVYRISKRGKKTKVHECTWGEHARIWAEGYAAGCEARLSQKRQMELT